MKKLVIVCLAVILLVFSLTIQEQDTLTYERVKVDIDPSSDMTLSNAVIEISGDADFASSGYPGSGTPEDPYRIENQVIPDSGIAISILDVRSYFAIQECTIGTTTWGNGPGILFENTTNGAVIDCVIQQKTAAIRFQETENCSIQECSLTNNYDRTIQITSSENCTVTDCTFTNNYGTPIDVRECEILSVVGNTLTGNNAGIKISYSDFAQISKNTLSNNVLDTISIEFSEDCNVSLNVFGSGGLRIIGNYDEWNHTVLDNTINSKELGYFFDISNTSLDCSFYNQLFIVFSKNISLSNGIFSNSAVAITIRSSQNITIDDCIIDNIRSGIELDQSLKVDIINTNISQSDQYGIRIHSTENTTVSNCRIVDCGFDSIHLFESECCIIKNNLLEKSNSYGFSIMGSNLSRFVNNTLRGVGFYILEYSNEYHFEGNLVNAKPVGYFVEKIDFHIQGTEYGQLLLDNCRNVSIEGGIFQNCTVGVQMGYTSYCVINGSLFGNQPYSGVRMEHSPNVIIANSTFLRSGSAIDAIRSNETTIKDNTFYKSSRSISMTECHRSKITNNQDSHSNNAIYIYVSNNTLIENNLISFVRDECILLSGGCNITAKRNIITDNDAAGLRLWNPSMSIFIENYLYNNTIGFDVESGSNNIFHSNRIGVLFGQTVYDFGNNNQWDDGVSQGNWWSDYSGNGLYNIPGSASSADNYPSVFELNPPVISAPVDVEFITGSPNQNITWMISESDPLYYAISVGGDVIEERDWTSSTIVLDISSFDIGVHEVTLTVCDGSLNEASDVVMVTVLLIPTNITTTTSTTSGEVSSIDPLLVLGVPSIILIVILVIALKRR